MITSLERISRRIRLALTVVAIAELAILAVAFVVTQVRARTEVTSGPTTCPALDDNLNSRKLTWHPGDQMVLHWIGQPCYPGTASGLPVTLNALLYGPFANDYAADAFVETTCGALSATPSPSVAMVAAAPTLHTNTSAAKEPIQILTLPVPLSPGDYAFEATATIHNPGVGTTGNSDICFSLRVTSP